MSRKKLIIAIVLMAALIAAGIVIPTVWRINKNRQKAPKETENISETVSEETEDSTDTELTFLEFDKLTAFFSESQITDFKEQIPEYLEKKELSGISSVKFLEDKTSYPSSTDTLLEFALSDGSTLPVTYSSPTGTFLFGTEKLQVREDTRKYERQTDETLPDVSTDDIENMQEDGFADTQNTEAETPTVTEAPSDTAEGNTKAAETQAPVPTTEGESE